MRKFLKIVGFVFLGFIVLVVIVAIVSPEMDDTTSTSVDSAESNRASETAPKPERLTFAPLRSEDAARTIRQRLSPTTAVTGNLRGFVANWEGQKCWYTQTATDPQSTSYFFQTLAGEDTFMEFDDPACMGSGTNGPLLGISQMMINNVIANWYSMPDAAFQTEVADLMSTSPLQARGWCVQSKTYPSQAFLVEYFTGPNNTLAAAVHQYALSGCEANP